jgi:hypothetical protein
MLGQFFVEPELELLEPEPDELEDPELALLDPVLELLELFELDGVVVVEELVPVLEPVVPVLDELVVAASATSAPPVTRPVVSAPIANTFRSRIFMVAVLSLHVRCRPVRSGSHTLRPLPVTRRTTPAACWLRSPTIT